MYFDWDRYAMYMRSKRKAKGYKSAEQFSKVLSEIYPFSPFKIYAIEQCQRKPTVEEFIVINYVLYGTVFPHKLVHEIVHVD